MVQQIKLPQWGMSMMDGTLTAWLVAPGDQISVGQPLIEVEASKATNTVDAMYAGTMGEILVAAGATVPVNTVLGTILEEGDPPSAPQAAPESSTDAMPSDASGPPAVVERVAPARQVQVVPLARKLAKDHGIDLATVAGSGPGGRITVADVEQALAGRTEPEPAASEPGRPMSQMRKIIAKRMVESLQTTAQLTLTSTADVTELVSLRQGWTGGRKPSFTDAVIRACALALRRHPNVNARIEGDRIVELDQVATGMAVAVQAGLIVPVIRDADRLALTELAEVTADLAAKAKARQLSLDAYSGATFTVTSLGGQGIDVFTPVLNSPEPAILGVGRAKEVAVRTPDGLAWRWQMTLSLTIDHRLIDGHPGALFLAEVVSLLADPASL